MRMILKVLTGIVTSICNKFATAKISSYIVKFVNNNNLNNSQKKLNNEIEQFYKENEHTFTNVTSSELKKFMNTYHPVDKIIHNSLSVSDSLPDEELKEILLTQLKDSISNSKNITFDEERLLKSVIDKIYSHVMNYIYNEIPSSQKQSTSILIQQTKAESKAILEKNENTFEYIKKELIKDTLSPTDKHSIVRKICQQMWLGQFKEVEELNKLNRKSDISSIIDILKIVMFEDNVEIDYISSLLNNIEDKLLRKITLYNCIPLFYFKKIDFSKLTDCQKSAFLDSLITSIRNNEPPSSSISMLSEDERLLLDRLNIIYLYYYQPENTYEFLIQEEKMKQNWLLTLLYYNRYINAYLFESIGALDSSMFNDIFQYLQQNKHIYSMISKDLQKIFYSLLLYLSINLDNINTGLILHEIPEELKSDSYIDKLQQIIKIKDNEHTISSVYDYCKLKNDYSILIVYLETNPDQISFLQDKIEILSSDISLFFYYIDYLINNSFYDYAKVLLNKLKDTYSYYYDFWYYYIEVENHSDKANNDFITLCSQNKISYIHGKSLINMISHLIELNELDIADKYNKKLDQKFFIRNQAKINDARILMNKKQYVNALEILKSIFDEFSDNLCVIYSIVELSIKLKRTLSSKYIVAAENTHSSDLLVILAQYFLENDDDIEKAKSTNLRALFLSDNPNNRAFDQYIHLYGIKQKNKLITITKSDTNTVVSLLNNRNNSTLRYIIHENTKLLPTSPHEWNDDIHLTIYDAINYGIYRKNLNDEVTIDKDVFTITDIEPLDSYLLKTSIKKAIESGAITAINVKEINSEPDISSLISQMKKLLPEENNKKEIIEQYLNYSSKQILPLYLVSQYFNLTYTEFIIHFINDSNLYIRDIPNTHKPTSNKYILSYSTLLILRKIGIPNNKFLNNNTFITESTKVQLLQDISKIISYYSTDEIHKIGLYEQKLMLTTIDEDIKNQLITEAGQIKKYVESIPTVPNSNDWKISSQNEQLDLIGILGNPDYDALALSIHDSYNLVNTEAFITELIPKYINTNSICITQWLLYSNIDLLDIVRFITNLIDLGTLFVITDSLILRLIQYTQTHNEDENERLLTLWISLLYKFNTLDKPIKLEVFTSIYHEYEKIAEKDESITKEPVIRNMFITMRNMSRE